MAIITDTDGINGQRLQAIGLVEALAERDTLQRAQRYALMANTADPGLICRRHLGAIGRAWRVMQPTGGGPTLRVLTDNSNGFWGAPVGATGIDAKGRVLQLDVDPGQTYRTLSEAIPPDDGVWRTLVVRFVHTKYEPGTLTFTAGSKTVTGTGTVFTRMTSRTDLYTAATGQGEFPARFVVDSGGNANGGTPWVVDAVASDTSLTLVNNALANQSGVKVWLRAWYHMNQDPTDKAMLRIPGVEFELVTRTRFPADDDFILADVRYDSGTSARVDIIDRRGANLWRSINERDSSYVPHLVLAQSWAIAGHSNSLRDNHTSPTVHTRPVVALSAQPVASSTAIAPLSDGTGYMAAVAHADGIRSCLYLHRNEMWGDYNATSGSRTFIESSNYSTVRGSVNLLALPPQSGFTHIAIYQRNGVIYRKLTANDGGSWGSEGTVWDLSAGTLINPTGANGGEMVHAILDRWHRIVVATSARAAVSSAGDETIRFATSSDYGVNWDTNSDGGYEISGSDGEWHPTLVETDDGNLVVVSISLTGTGVTVLRQLADAQTLDDWRSTIIQGYTALGTPHQGFNNVRSVEATSASAQSADAVWIGFVAAGPNNSIWVITQKVGTTGTPAAYDSVQVVADLYTIDSTTYTSSLCASQPLLMSDIGATTPTNRSLALSGCVGINGKIELLSRRFTSATNGGVVDHYTVLPTLLAAPASRQGGWDALGDP
jgi:hypothetical protein